MVEYRNDGTDVHRTKSRGPGTIIVLLLVVAALIVALLFATGFWSANVKEGALPTVSVDGGALPKVDVDSKEVVVGTKKTEVEVPTVKTETTTIDVPTVGVTDDKK